MNLLHLTIKEYLADNHSEWKTVSDAYDGNTIYIVKEGSTVKHVVISTTTQTLATNNYPSRIPYTETTLLQQITHTINHIEKS